MIDNPVALITGSARRVGEAIAEHLHAELKMNILIHYRHHQAQAQQLVNKLNALRANSAECVCADLCDPSTWQPLIEIAHARWGRLDALVNNASDFFQTPIQTVTVEQWDQLLTVNLKAPYFLARYAAPYLAQAKGSIINITDTHAQKPLSGYSAYSISKAGLHAMTQALAKELGPAIRVNAVAPGAVAWPEGTEVIDEAIKQKIIEKTALKRAGEPHDIALAVASFLMQPYVTGQSLAVDGGRS